MPVGFFALRRFGLRRFGFGRILVRACVRKRKLAILTPDGCFDDRHLDLL